MQWKAWWDIQRKGEELFELEVILGDIGCVLYEHDLLECTHKRSAKVVAGPGHMTRARGVMDSI